jgi:hypothetical protein
LQYCLSNDITRTAVTSNETAALQHPRCITQTISPVDISVIISVSTVQKKIPSAAFTRIFPWLVFDRQDIHSLGTRPPWSPDKRAAPMRGKDKRNQNKKLRRWTPEKKQEQLLFLFSPDGKDWFDRGEV